MTSTNTNRQPSELDTPGGWAERYAVAGLPVLPLHWPADTGCSCGDRQCRNVGKHPLSALVPHGKDDATTDAATVTAWWSRYPHANVGIRPPVGVIVLDIDPRHGGDASLDELRRLAGGDLPATRSARTGSGGSHLWFAYGGRYGGRLRRDGETVPGIDVKAHSGYLVAPPSVHACGERYAWTDPGSEALAPTWLRRLLDPPAPVLSRRQSTGDIGLDPLVRMVERADDGNLNNSLYWACIRAHADGLDVNPLVDTAVAKGHPRRGAELTAASAANSPERTTQ